MALTATVTKQARLTIHLRAVSRHKERGHMVAITFVIIGLILMAFGVVLLVRPQTLTTGSAEVGGVRVSVPAGVVVVALGLAAAVFPFSPYYKSPERPASQPPKNSSSADRPSTSLPTNGPTTGVAPTGAPKISFTIAEPRPNAVVPENGFPVSGQSSLGVTDSLWVVYRGITNSNLSFQPAPAPCSIATDGSFSCPRQYVGGTDDSGEKFELFFLLTDPDAAQVFRDYEASDPAARGYPGLDSLPAGVRQVGTVTVIRA